MIPQVKKFAKRSKAMIITYHIYDNWQLKKQFNSGKVESSCGSTHSKIPLSESLDYINSVFNDYLKYSHIPTQVIRNKKILEIGSGDNFGVALKFLIAGALEVVCLDKFYSKRDPEHQYKIYQAMRKNLDNDSKQRFDDAINLSNGIEINPEKLKYIYGKGIEEAEKLFNPSSFDFIVSRAVLEHLYDSDAAFSVMDNLLTPGGYMIHKIDFRDHKIFTAQGMHPLTFLTIHDPIYRLMTINSGKPNRKLINYYKNKLYELKYCADIYIIRILGENSEIFPHKKNIELGIDYFESTISLINKIRSKLIANFRNMPEEDLIISGIFLTAIKPNPDKSETKRQGSIKSGNERIDDMVKICKDV